MSSVKPVPSNSPSKQVRSPQARLVTVTATDGLMLPALLFEPEKPAKSILIWLHGMGSSGAFYSVTHTNAIAKAVTDAGIAFLALNNRGAGMLQGLKYLDEAGERQRVVVGTTHELITDCPKDIDGAVSFATELGYNHFFLGGHSTGANKVCLYNFLCPDNPFAGYVIYGGGDDTGIYAEEMGEPKFRQVLQAAKTKITAGHGADLAPIDVMGDYFSYQSIADILDPDGGYNVFSYYETRMGPLGTKPLFREFASIKKPSLVVYGEQDEYCLPSPAACLEILKSHASDAKLFTYELVAGGDHGCYGHESQLAATIARWLAGQHQ